jgi:hypothetical protein
MKQRLWVLAKFGWAASSLFYGGKWIIRNTRVLVKEVKDHDCGGSFYNAPVSPTSALNKTKSNSNFIEHCTQIWQGCAKVSEDSNYPCVQHN